MQTFYPCFGLKPAVRIGQPADLPKDTGYDLPTARRCFAKVLPLTLPYRQNNAVE